MRLQAITLLRMPGGKGVVYQAGQEFEVPDDYKGRNLAKVLIAAKRARKFEPVAIGSPPPLPPQKAVAPPPESMPEPPPESTPEPTPEPEPSLLHKVMQADETAPAEADEAASAPEGPAQAAAEEKIAAESPVAPSPDRSPAGVVH